MLDMKPGIGTRRSCSRIPLIGPGAAADNMFIYARDDKNRIDFYPVEHIPAGTSVETLPWTVK